MRLYKKAAVGLLAAVMAVSMLTACGGGGGSTGGNGGDSGNNGGSTEVTDVLSPDQFENVGADDSDDGQSGHRLRMFTAANMQLSSRMCRIMLQPAFT